VGDQGFCRGEQLLHVSGVGLREAVIRDGVGITEGLKEIVFPTPEQSLAAAREALIELYNATDGDNWKNNTNWCSDKPLDE
jgi:hypothetical protein